MKPGGRFHHHQPERLIRGKAHDGVFLRLGSPAMAQISCELWDSLQRRVYRDVLTDVGDRVWDAIDVRLRREPDAPDSGRTVG